MRCMLEILYGTAIITILSFMWTAAMCIAAQECPFVVLLVRPVMLVLMVQMVTPLFVERTTTPKLTRLRW